MDGSLDDEICSARVPDGGDTAVEGGGKVAGRLVELVGERPLETPQEVGARAGHVHVTVEQARKQRAVGDIHAVVAVQPGAHCHDAPVLKRHVTIGDRAAGAVKDPPAVKDRPAHPLVLLLFSVRRLTGHRT